jgi:alpha-beta hydrolase superfamily lysophospholipase
MKARTVVFVHGMFVTAKCWASWIERYQARGLRCIAPAWPGRDRPVEQLRAMHPDPHLGQLSLGEVVQHYAEIIEDLNEKPILIGHSMGGLIVQLLLQRKLGCAGIAIDSAPPVGVVTLSWSFLRSNWPSLNPLISRHVPYLMPFEHFQYTFVHTLPLAKQRAAYDEHVVPESRWVARGPLSSAARVDFSAPRALLLLIAGVEDHIIPASLNAANYLKYGRGPAVTGYKEFEGRTHFILAQSGWEEVADYALDWCDEKEL